MYTIDQHHTLKIDRQASQKTTTGIPFQRPYPKWLTDCSILVWDKGQGTQNLYILRPLIEFYNLSSNRSMQSTNHPILYKECSELWKQGDMRTRMFFFFKKKKRSKYSEMNQGRKKKKWWSCQVSTYRKYNWRYQSHGSMDRLTIISWSITRVVWCVGSDLVFEKTWREKVHQTKKTMVPVQVFYLSVMINILYVCMIRAYQSSKILTYESWITSVPPTNHELTQEPRQLKTKSHFGWCYWVALFVVLP